MLIFTIAAASSWVPSHSLHKTTGDQTLLAIQSSCDILIRGDEMKQFLWVTNTNENKAYYADCPKRGLWLHFDKEIDASLKKDILSFIKYLRRDFYFPAKCHVYFKNVTNWPSKKKGHTCTGIFFSNEERKGTYPQIHVAADIGDTSKYNIFFTICHELTHYFQWYFLLEDTHSDKGLEIQASHYANRIVNDYYDEFGDNS